MLPMYQSEALWLNFNSEYLGDHDTSYPFAIKVATGKINAVTGKNWRDGLKRRSQDYMVSTEQPWLDGYLLKKDLSGSLLLCPLDLDTVLKSKSQVKLSMAGFRLSFTV
jgi:hypothetical protein